MKQSIKYEKRNITRTYPLVVIRILFVSDCIILLWVNVLNLCSSNAAYLSTAEVMRWNWFDHIKQMMYHWIAYHSTIHRKTADNEIHYVCGCCGGSTIGTQGSLFQCWIRDYMARSHNVTNSKVQVIVSLWNLRRCSAVVMLRYLSNFGVIG